MANNLTHLDLRKKDVQIGDTLAVSFRAGNSAELRIGTVTGFSSRASAYDVDRVQLIDVDWDPEITRYPARSKIEANNGRYIIIDRAALPTE